MYLKRCMIMAAGRLSPIPGKHSGRPSSHLTERHRGSPNRAQVEALDSQRVLLAQKARGFAAKDGTVLWTLANLSWLEFVLNWVATVQKANVSHYFVATLDDE